MFLAAKKMRRENKRIFLISLTFNTHNFPQYLSKISSIKNNIAININNLNIFFVHLKLILENKYSIHLKLNKLKTKVNF